MPFTKRETLVATAIREDLLLVIAIGLFFGWINPFAAFGVLGPIDRFVYWVIALLVSWPQLALAQHLINGYDWVRRASYPLAAIPAAVVSAIPVTLAIAWLESIFRLGQTVPLRLIPELYMNVTVILIAVALVLELARRKREAERAVALRSAPVILGEEEGNRPVASDEVRFLRRIPRNLGVELLALQAEDHYLRIHTRVGSDLILFRLSDAMEELDSLEGLQVHRSWWVARAAIQTVLREGGRVHLVLVNGQKVPVSRTYLTSVRSVGWQEVSGAVEQPPA